MKRFLDTDFSKIILTFSLLLFFLSLWALLSYFARQGLPVLLNISFKMALTLAYLPIFLVESLPSKIHFSSFSFAIYFFIFLVYSFIVSTLILLVYKIIKRHL